MVKRSEPITLTKTHFLYVGFICLVVLPVILSFVFSTSLYGFWCAQFQMPEYEERFGFTFGTLEYTGADGKIHEASGIIAVEPGGAFARAGIRPGDVPRMHHGIGDICGSLGAASEGYKATLRVINVGDLPADGHDWRTITVPVSSQ